MIQNLTESAAAYSVRGEGLSYGLLGGPAKTPARMEPDVHLHDPLLQMLQCLGKAKGITVSFLLYFFLFLIVGRFGGGFFLMIRVDIYI